MYWSRGGSSEDKVEQLLKVAAPKTKKWNSYSKVAAPKTKKQVRAFLGLSGYYRKYVKNYAAVAAPLTDLTKKGAPNQVKWNDDLQRSFEALKHNSLSTAPVL